MVITTSAQAASFAVFRPQIRRRHGCPLFVRVFGRAVCLATYLVTYLHAALGYSLVAAGGLLAAAQLGGVAEVARIALPGKESAATGGALAVTFLGVVIGPARFGALTSLFNSYRAGFLALALPAAVCCWLVAARKPLFQ